MHREIGKLRCRKQCFEIKPTFNVDFRGKEGKMSKKLQIKNYCRCFVLPVKLQKVLSELKWNKPHVFLMHKATPA